MQVNSEFTLPPLLGPSLWQFRAWAGSEQIRLSGAFIFERGRPFSQIKILGSNGPLRFSIPVKKHPPGASLADIRIDHIQKWQNQIWRSLVSCYKKSPYFDFYEKELEILFYQKPDLLTEFTMPLFQWLLNQYFPTKPVSAILAPESFGASAGKPSHFFFEKPESSENQDWPYTQVFGQVFEGNLSMWDALFCMGPKFGIVRN
jgi:hypothetical protein